MKKQLLTSSGILWSCLVAVAMMMVAQSASADQSAIVQIGPKSSVIPHTTARVGNVPQTQHSFEAVAPRQDLARRDFTLVDGNRTIDPVKQKPVIRERFSIMQPQTVGNNVGKQYLGHGVDYLVNEATDWTMQRGKTVMNNEEVQCFVNMIPLPAAISNQYPDGINVVYEQSGSTITVKPQVIGSTTDENGKVEYILICSYTADNGCIVLTEDENGSLKTIDDEAICIGRWSTNKFDKSWESYLGAYSLIKNVKYRLPDEPAEAPKDVFCEPDELVLFAGLSLSGYSYNNNQAVMGAYAPTTFHNGTFDIVTGFKWSVTEYDGDNETSITSNDRNFTLTTKGGATYEDFSLIAYNQDAVSEPYTWGYGHCPNSDETGPRYETIIAYAGHGARSFQFNDGSYATMTRQNPDGDLTFYTNWGTPDKYDRSVISKIYSYQGKPSTPLYFTGVTLPLVGASFNDDFNLHIKICKCTRSLSGRIEIGDIIAEGDATSENINADYDIGLTGVEFTELYKKDESGINKALDYLFVEDEFVIIIEGWDNGTFSGVLGSQDIDVCHFKSTWFEKAGEEGSMYSYNAWFPQLFIGLIDATYGYLYTEDDTNLIFDKDGGSSSIHVNPMYYTHDNETGEPTYLLNIESVTENGEEVDDIPKWISVSVANEDYTTATKMDDEGNEYEYFVNGIDYDLVVKAEPIPDGLEYRTAQIVFYQTGAKLTVTITQNVTESSSELKKVDGVYQIATVADLKAFAELVNNGEVNANAVLTADIDLGTDVIMIGVADAQGQRYDGTFDGQGYAIKINMCPEANDAGLFRYIGWRAVIQNLKVEGTITTSSKFAGGIVGRGRGIVRNCYADITINSSVPGDATHGGIVAVGYSGTIVENCLAKIAIVGETTQNCGGVVGWAENSCNIVNCLVISDGSTIDVSNGLSRNIARNDSRVNAINVETYNADPYGYRDSGAGMGACYNNYVTQQWGDNVATAVVAYDDLADGRICYQLNNDQSRIGWVQRIGTDPFPIPAAFGSGQVYASGSTSCDGKAESDLTFSNEGSDQAAKHQFDKYGVCSACGCFNFHYFEVDDPEMFDQKDRAVFLRTKEDIDMAEGMNRICNGFKLNMKLMNDMVYIAEPGKYIFNNRDWIDGNFDGQGHAFTMGISEVDGYAGLFPEMAGNVENLILHGTLQTNGARVGSLCAEARMALVRNVYSDVDITSTVVGDNTSGGFFGWTGGVEKRVENCIYAGTFTLPGAEGGANCARVGGYAGWTATKTYYTNCAVLGNIIGAGNQTTDTDTENSQNIARNPGSVVCENVYVVNPIYGNSVSDMKEDGTTAEGITHYQNTAGIANGELAFFLNSKQNGLERFFQVIGTDLEPMPIKKEGALVYSVANEYQCDGTPIGSNVFYSNSASGGGVIPPHQYEDGWCAVCGKLDENFVTPINGKFEICNAAELTWWSNYASIHPNASVLLKDDIDMDRYMDRYIPVLQYYGEFNGQGHTISNFVINNSNNLNGVISTIVSGANIHDLVLDETCLIHSGSYAGIIGSTEGSGTIYITNVGFEGTVGVDVRNAAGLVGCCSGGSMDMFITNCWVTGRITGGFESSAICGYSGSGSIVKNCWSTCQMPSSSIYSSDSFTRGSAQVINCYEADIEGVDPTKQQHINPIDESRRVNPITPEEVANGALCYKLNGDQTEISWYQTLGEDNHPVPDNRHLRVWYDGTFYTNQEQDKKIIFADANVKAICVSNWDTNGDRELSYGEAAAVKDLGEAFTGSTTISSFEELQYFTGLTEIGEEAFYGCSGLTSFMIPNSVKTLGIRAFMDCSGLTSVTISNGVTSIKGQAFSGCSGLTTIVVEVGNTKYDSRNNCNAIIETSSNTLIAGCKNTTIPNSVTCIGGWAFEDCGLTSITIPNSVTNIDISAFQHCGSLTSISIPNSVTTIGSYAFTGCYGLTTITIPNSVTSIGEYIFCNCNGLTSVIIGNGVTSIGESSFYYCTNLASVSIGNSVTSIGKFAFDGCIGLKTVVIPNSVTRIDDYAFYNCGLLTSVEIGSSVTYIGDNAFNSCMNLAVVRMESSTPVDILDNTFDHRSSVILSVPKGSKSSYQAAEYWKDFKRIVEDVEGDVNVDENVNVLDVVDIARFVVGNPAKTFVEFLADINKDGAVNLGDAVVLVNEIAGDQNFVKAWHAPSRVTANDILSLTEHNGHLSLNLENERYYTAFQFDLYVPEDADVTQMMLNAERKQGHQLLYNKVEDGHYRVAALSTSNRTFDGDNGELLSIALDEISGEEVSICDIHFFDTMGNDYLFEDIEGAITTSLTPTFSKGEEDIYDIQGRKREKVQRGVNIVNGRKIIKE